MKNTLSSGTAVYSSNLKLFLTVYRQKKDQTDSETYLIDDRHTRLYEL